MSDTMERALDELAKVDVEYSVSDEDLEDRIEDGAIVIAPDATSKLKH